MSYQQISCAIDILVYLSQQFIFYAGIAIVLCQ